MEIINDLAPLFDGFMIDLTNIGAGDKASPDKTNLIKQFEQLLNAAKNSEGYNEKRNNQDHGKPAIEFGVQSILNDMVPESTNIQYHNGL